ncbi:MAG: protein CapI [Candidatus Marinimicrobia bacterium]|nr:protein CapI [Candidatus Neomarinimicrobiota bacterium]
MQNKILVTGAAGFIGYHLCSSLAKDNYEILGVDNLNDYYDVKLKNSRIKGLEGYNNFTFKRADLCDNNTLKVLFKSFKPKIVINLAAQAGVRYSIENPYSYIDSNIIGFQNLIELSRNNNIDHFIYASSSSVYGNNKKIPFSESNKVDEPISLYGATKKSNELISYSYSHLYNLKTTGLRFFTVYGPWGRPDMSYFIFTKNIIRGNPINVYNNGNMKRDFTYIDDIIMGIKSSIFNDTNKLYQIYNLGNSKPEKLLYFISLIEQTLNIKAKIKYKTLQLGDVLDTCADISKSNVELDYNPSISIEEGIPLFIDWYKKFYL